MRKSIYSLLLALSSLIISPDVFCQLVNDFKVNGGLTSSDEYNSKIGTDSLGNFIIAWPDQRRAGGYDVYLQKYLSTGIPVGENIKINGDISNSGSPDIAVKSDGNYFVIWTDRIGSTKYYRFKYFNSNGDSLTSTQNFTEGFSDYVSLYKIDLCPNGSAIVSWLRFDENFQFFKIQYQCFDSNGLKIGGNITATDSIVRKDQSTLCVRNDGSFIIAWQESTVNQGGYNIAMQLYDANGNRIGNKIIANNLTSNFDTYRFPVISSDSSGRFAISFNFYHVKNNSHSAALQLFNKDGSKKGTNIYFGHFGFDRGSANVTKQDDGNMLLSYNTTLNGYDRHIMLKADTSGNFVGTEFMLSDINNASDQEGLDFKIKNGRIISTWSDNRNGNYDIFGNIRSYQRPDSVVSVKSISSEIPNNFKLYQNYPNPFNPETNIMFDINKSGNLQLKIFDISGRERAEIINENFTPGSYKIKYNFSEFESGVYFYSLYSNGNIINTKKLILLK